MVFIVITVLSSTLIYVFFRIAKNFDCNLSSLITINYFVATILGLLFFTDFNSDFFTTINWLPFGLILGFFFIILFNLIGISSQKAGITITTLANKLSLVFPVLFSIVLYNENITIGKTIGLTSALIAILLTVYKKETTRAKLFYILLPLLIFIGSGATDTFVKYVQASIIIPLYTAQFSSFVFFVAFILAAIISVFKKNKIKINSPTLFIGIFLGIANFCSLYFLINALNNSQLDSSLIFAVVNMSIVALSAIAGKLFFREKLTKLNLAGIILAIVSLYFIM